MKGVQNPFTYSTPSSGIRDYSSTSAVGASVVETIALNAANEIEYQLEQARTLIGKPPMKRGRPNPFVPFMQDGAKLTDEQMASVISSTFSRVVSRAPNETEVRKYVDFLKKNIRETGDAPASLKATLTAVYLSPEAIYRMEWGLGPVDKHGRRLLSPDELAYALSYALFDTGPTGGGNSENAKRIGQALASGKLTTREDVAMVVAQILNSETHRPIGGQAKNVVPRIMRFFHEFFGYNKATTVFKDRARVNQHDLYHDPRHLVVAADNLIKVILREDRNVFEELLTTNRALVFHDGNNQAQIDRHKAFNELFGSAVMSDAELKKGGAIQRNLMDFLQADVKRIRNRLSADDRERFDGYVDTFESLRVREERKVSLKSRIAKNNPGYNADKYTSMTHMDRMECQFELGTAAIIAGLTNVITLRPDTLGAMYQRLGTGSLGLHQIGHGAGLTDGTTSVQLRKKIVGYHIGLMAKMAARLDGIPEGNGTMLDNTLIVYTSCTGGKHHAGTTDWPFLLLGGVGDKLKLGRYLQYPSYTRKGHKSIANLYMSIMQAADVTYGAHFGQVDPSLRDIDVSGPLSELLM